MFFLIFAVIFISVVTGIALVYERLIQKRFLQLVYEALKEIEATPVFEREAIGTGICGMAYEACEPKLKEEVVNAILKKLFEGWEHHSGDPSWPVPGPEGFSPITAFAQLPLWHGEYGAKRKELLKYAIKKAEKLLRKGYNAWK